MSGSNRGLNLEAIKVLLPDCQTSGLEINSYAADECSSKGHNIIRVLSFSPDSLTEHLNSFQLSFISVFSSILIPTP